MKLEKEPNTKFAVNFIDYAVRIHSIKTMDELLDFFSNIDNYVDFEAEGLAIYSLGWSVDYLLREAIETNDNVVDIVISIGNDTDWTIEQGALDVLNVIERNI